MHPDKEFMEDEYHENGDENEWYTAAPSDEQELDEASLAYLDSIIDRPVPDQQELSQNQNEYDQEMFEDANEE
ncbi:14792_t:CDS:2 [Acaulospora colombiana]|uniref:14792_t:CDS:1 n=1 Tax=Acaulospora colombiana TaxID=27376 RepID=A0ACA9MFY0_9GLOM|nr:14792_t:CDS:2 [Acaulospora colombiana]